MFTISIYKLGSKIAQAVIPTVVETLAEAEIIALDRAERIFGVVDIELVYVEDLSYYVYSPDYRIGRLTIIPVYAKKGIRK